MRCNFHNELKIEQIILFQLDWVSPNSLVKLSNRIYEREGDDRDRLRLLVGSDEKKIVHVISRKCHNLNLTRPLKSLSLIILNCSSIQNRRNIVTNQGKLLLMTLMTTHTQIWARIVYSIQAIKIKSVKSLTSPSLALHLSWWELPVAYSILTGHFHIVRAMKITIIKMVLVHCHYWWTSWKLIKSKLLQRFGHVNPCEHLPRYKTSHPV